MGNDLKQRPISGANEAGAGEAAQKQRKPSRRRRERWPEKRTMNLYYKPDRTTKPATIALYVLFVLVCLLGLSKVLVYDIWADTVQARSELAAEEARLSSIMLELADYGEVREKYQRYSATDEERELVDRMEILALLDEAVGSVAVMDSLVIDKGTVQIQFSGVTLAQTAQIVHALEAAPIVAGTTVSTASTTKEGEAVDENSSLIQVNVLIHLQKGGGQE